MGRSVHFLANCAPVVNLPKNMKKTLLTLFALLLSSVCMAGESYSIRPLKKERICQGWGTSLCWWAAQSGRWDEERLDSLIDWLVSPQGLNYNVFRYNIGGGDDPHWTNCDPHHFGASGGKGLRAELEGFKVHPDSAYNWQADEAQRRIMLMIKRKRPDAIFEAFSNSAPWWMTVSGCVGGAKKATDDNVAPAMYESFARYLVDVCKHYKDTYGIEFATLDPFNEPVTDYWYQNGGQEGCHFSVEGQIAMIKVLRRELDRSGLRTVISAADETSVMQSIIDLKAYDRAGVLKLVGQWNTHTYKADNEQRKRLRELCDSLDIRLWQSETGDGGKGIHGNLRMAQRLVDDIRYLQPDVWCDWQYVEENYDQWSLVMCDSTWGTFRRHHNYYVRQMFSRFIPVGYRWMDVDDEHGLAAQSPDGKQLVYVTLNADRGSRTTEVKVPKGYRLKAIYRTSRTEDCIPLPINDKQKNRTIFTTLPSLSIVTMVMEK